MSPKSARRSGPLGLEVTAIIRERMGRRRITQADLVRETMIDQSKLSRILDDKRTVDIEELQSIAVVLGTTAGAIIDEAVEICARSTRQREG